jgi:hypothetical protein
VRHSTLVGATTMLGTLRNSITALIGRLGLGGGGAKSTTDLAAAIFFR